MKKILKIVLPILLVLVLLAAGWWFFFRARVDLTTDLLRQFAEGQLEDGHYDSAIRFFGWANSLTPEDAELAMELAEAYRQSGNFTKTESVLVHAIYENPEDVRLYRMLSRVYVEQDKLLDAQQMLDNIANETVRESLSAERPTAPEFSPAGSFYSEYITVELSAPGAAACFVTDDGSYPTVAEDRWTGAITLSGGETTLCAVAVSSDGLVSPATYARYTVTGVVEDVEFRDEVLLAAVQELLHKGGRTLRTDELWGIEDFGLPEGLTDSSDLKYFTGMTKLTGANLGELDYSFLASMPELRYLELESCLLSQENLKQIAACQKLEVLILAGCGLTDVESLRGLSTLRVLDLSDNSIADISPLMGMETLDELYLGHNALTMVPSLRGLSRLRILDLSFNAIDYTGGVSTCTTLERLNLSHNSLKSAVSISALKELVWLNLSYNEIVDVSSLAACTHASTITGAIG